MSDENLSQDPQALDVSNPETHYQVQCAEVRLLSSQLKPLDAPAEGVQASHFLFKIQVSIQKNTAISRLNVQVLALNEEEGDPLAGYDLRFTLLGIFSGEPSIPPEKLADFARMYSLSILWPYAREYTSDQLRRTGQPFDSLPIINPQVVTEKLIEAGLVSVELIEGPDVPEIPAAAVE